MFLHGMLIKQSYLIG